MHINYTEPYRIFFPIGILGAITGVIVWIFPWLINLDILPVGWFLNAYPVMKHVELLSGLFLLPIVIGFLLTAIPRFVMGTGFLNIYGLSYFILLQILIIFFSIFYDDRLIFYFLYSLTLFSASIFIFGKFYESRSKVSPYLYFSLIGTLLGFLGGLVMFFSAYFGTSLWIGLGRHLIYYGFLPFLILSFGTKLIIPIVVGQNPTLKNQWIKIAENISGRTLIIFITLYISSFVIEFFSTLYGIQSLQFLFAGLRLCLLLFWFIKFFHLKEFQSFKGTMPIVVYISICTFLLGLGGYAFGGNHAIHFAHIYFIGGLSLFVFCIMVRVVLSHSGKDVSIEKTSKIFYWFAFLLILAALTRGTAHLFPSIFISHLAYASIVYILFLITWTVWIIRHLFHK